jgi:hypothetical protein
MGAKMTDKRTKQAGHLFESTALRGSLSRDGITLGLIAGIAGVFLLAGPDRAQAFSAYDGTSAGNNLEVNLNTTISYTPIFRTNNPSSTLTSVANANGSEGDIDFAHGLVSNQFSILPILDIKDGNFGAHFSGQAYVNTSYLGTNQNDQPLTLNPISVSKNDDFTSATRNVEGLNAQVLDAFGYGSWHFGADDVQSFSVKIGRQTLLWGQSLYLASNGIAYGQAPIDVITAQNTPNAQAQQVFTPIPQAVLTYQPNDILTLQAYYQFGWEKYLLQGVGAYFSTSDILDAGGQRLLLAGTNQLPQYNVLRGHDLTPPNNNGQFGASVQLTLGNYDIGFYGLRFDSKTPAVYYAPLAANYILVYPRDIWIEGTSLSTTVGPANVAGEVSFRQHMNLAGGLGISTPLNPGNANSDPLYPVGDTMAGQVSAIYVTSGIPFDPGGIAFSGEIGFNHVLSVTANDAAISQGRTSTAALMDIVATPNYYNVLPNLSLGFPVGFSYNLYGRSMVSSNENHGTGSINFGVTATYNVTWIASMTFNDYLGAPNTVLNPSADRNYVLLNFQHSF